MNLHDIKNIDKDDILGALGLQTRRSTMSWLFGTMGLFGLGLMVGASLALLLAPKSGRELRRDIGHRFRRAPEPGDGQSLEGAM